ncbi:MAG: YggS family pyridoxal phosphate-dependent enzyme [Candidatus Omnitrophica bacterium]|nr:YggS family pyridoxal phosphate-dependent enzyme [Candidatus Omnitrophota bacterium]MDD5552920.1 YggS family pyridoxal phosphate-dependent enzyme [Candidatus Omnitrophota bacterium]
MIRDNIFKVRERVDAACLRAKREPSAVTIVAVSKGRPAEQVKEALGAGILDIGENRVQEALLKYDQLRDSGLVIKWHMVGHLQTNKVKDAVRIFDLIQSVDSLRLAEEIDRQASKINKVQDILFEIKTSPEETKTGVDPDKAAEVMKEAGRLKNINVKGLMTIAPIVEDPGQARQFFRKLREISENLFGRHPETDASVLSMGMTDDFETAVEEGATMVRIGRAIFG